MRHMSRWLWGALLISGAALFSGCMSDSEGPLGPAGPDAEAEEQRVHATPWKDRLGNGNGNDNGTNGNDNGTNDNDNGTNDNDNGTNGNDNGTNGNDNGTNGNDNDNGTNGNDNGTNGNDNGTNGNDNGTNGNDNGTNGNDNGTNGNDNGTNGNDNGTNGNDNGGGGGLCPDGSTQLYTEMGGSDDNRVEYDELGGCREFRVRVRDLSPYMTYQVMVEGVSVGSLTTDDDGRGELRYQGSQFPMDFPDLQEGDQVTVGPVSGALFLACSGNVNCNG